MARRFLEADSEIRISLNSLGCGSCEQRFISKDALRDHVLEAHTFQTNDATVEIERRLLGAVFELQCPLPQASHLDLQAPSEISATWQVYNQNLFFYNHFLFRLQNNVYSLYPDEKEDESLVKKEKGEVKQESDWAYPNCKIIGVGEDVNESLFKDKISDRGPEGWSA